MKTNNWKQTSHYNSRTLQGHLSHLSLLDYNTDLLEINDQDIYPARSELFAKSRPSIAPNKIKGPYSSVENYLKIQYDLLREDFIGPLRQDLAALCKDRDTVQNIYFHNVKFLRKGIKQDSTCHCVKILSKLDKEVVASDSKRLITGSFLLFYYKDLHTAICGKVEDNDLSKSQRLIVSLHPDTYMYLNKVYTMIEYSVLFEPYYNALRALKGMSDYTFPMERYIVNLNLSVNRPSYLVGITRNVYERNLNKYQLAAWQNAVNKEFVLIQGPPGTGKTFLALKIVKDLIINCNRESPILIVTYKNHALDTFLEGLCGTTKDIIRLGGQSKNRKMAELSIKNQRIQQREHGITGNSAFAVNKLYKSYISAEQKLKSFGEHLDMVLTGEAIVQFSALDKSLPKFCPRMWEDVGFNHEKRIMWLLQSNDHGEDFELLEKAASLLQLLHKSGEWLFTMSSIKSICKDIEDLINCKDVEMPLSVQCDKKLCELSNKKLKKLKELFLKQISKIKNYMTSDLPKIEISNMTDLVTNPFNIPVRGRWQLYREWIDKYAARYHENIDKAIVECKEAYKDFDRASLPDNVELMKGMKVIGMTTTCAARIRSTLELLKCPIVVVEEAAEVLEAHVVSVVTKHCKHLILIGDHQQLRPSVADYEIDTKYNLGVSLFERMVMNGVECHTLNVQHRMRPEISRLIVPAIYPNLKDHESVTKYPDVRGIDGNAFFLDHNELEEDALEQSKKNTHEARFLISLAQYLLMNGYQPEEITILSGYLGQVKTLDKERRLCSHEGMKKIAIKSVDDYQGEENKIILLSLVRNNAHRRIGFLSNEKRVCVALSRAREGLYIMGNIRHLSARSKLWRQIRQKLEFHRAVGRKLGLKCQIHGGIAYVQSPKDFKNIKEAGCNNSCKVQLKDVQVQLKDVPHIAVDSCDGNSSSPKDFKNIKEAGCNNSCKVQLKDVQVQLKDVQVQLKDVPHIAVDSCDGNSSRCIFHPSEVVFISTILYCLTPSWFYFLILW